MPVLSDVKLPDIEMPDVSKIDLSGIELPKIDFSKVDTDKARHNVSKATSKAAASVRGAVSERLPRQSAPSPLPFVVGGLLAGMTIGYFLATSAWFGPRIKDAVDQIRARMQQRSGTGYDTFADSSQTTFPAVRSDVTDLTDSDLTPAGADRSNEETYAV